MNEQLKTIGQSDKLDPDLDAIDTEDDHSDNPKLYVDVNIGRS